MAEAVALRVVVPGVPDPELSPNSRAHHRVKARKRRQLREFSGWAMKESAPERPISGPVVVTVTVGWPKRRPGMDIDNCTASLKGAIDALMDAGFIVDDSQIQELRVRQRKWGEWSNQGGWLYAAGCMTFDVEELVA